MKLKTKLFIIAYTMGGKVTKKSKEETTIKTKITLL